MLTGKLIVKVKETFGDEVDLNLYDPRSPFWIWDIVKFSIRGGEPAWVLEGELIFKGVPDWEDLKKAIDTGVKKNKERGGFL